MSAIEQQLLETLRRLPAPQQQEILAFVVRMEQQTPHPRPSVLQRIQALTADVPVEVWERVPVDGAEQHNHYLYGTPKQ